MDSEFENNENTSGLLRFRSAPSSLLQNFTDGICKTEVLSTENKGLGSRFNLAGANSQLVAHNSLDGVSLKFNLDGANSQLVSHNSLESFTDGVCKNGNMSTESGLGSKINLASVNSQMVPQSSLESFSDGVSKIGNKGLPSKFNLAGANNQLVSQNSLDSKGLRALSSQLPPQYPRQNSSTTAHVGSMDSGHRVMGSLGMDQKGQNKLVSNLTRQNSSPAGLFSLLNAPNGYTTLKRGYRMANDANGDSSPSSSRLKGHFSYQSGTPSSLGMLSRISEVDNESSIATAPDEEKCGDGNSESQFYNMAYPFTSWSDSSFQDMITGQKRELENVQIEELGNRPPILSHHLSLPNTPAEMAAMEKLLHFQDTIPCKIRAKRGCATHPRSIAERVRRTRISERMRKLQELVPNMDKQTNTSDMLDLAVEYIKDLQRQYKTLSEYRANCKCSAMEKP